MQESDLGSQYMVWETSTLEFKNISSKISEKSTNKPIKVKQTLQ